MVEEQDPKEIVVEAMKDVAQVYGMRESYAQIYGTLYFKTEAMIMDELVEETGLAKSTISDALNELEEMYLVHSEKREGHGKTKFYTAEEDLEKVMKKFMDNQASNEIEIMLDALEEAEQKSEEGTTEQEKIKNLQEFYQKSRRLMKLFKKMPSGKTLSNVTSALKNTLTREN
ncbi:MAG: DNA-binding transcriptional regulator GbsR (MarR family) [Candidatus Nanohaloarchaea archaeon]|jgi:DNA-binding transcriptional regulator GbsR (MarR family)